MAAQRKPAIRAPRSRTYQSAPRLHQRRFAPYAPVSRGVRAATQEEKEDLKRQATLTQLDFVHMEVDLPAGNQSHSEDNHSNEDWSEPRRAKRQRLTKDETDQSTLTQIDWLGNDCTTSAMDCDMAPLQVLPQSNLRPKTEPVTIENVQQGFSLDLAGSREPNEDPISQNSNSHTPFIIREDTPPKSSSKNKGRTQSKTTRPRRSPIRRRVSSSQSPAGSPENIAKCSNSLAQRMPLQELPANVLAQRDEEATKQGKVGGKKKIIPESQHDGLDEDDEGDWENWDPVDESDSDNEGPPSPLQDKFASMESSRSSAERHRGNHLMAPMSLPQSSRATTESAVSSVASPALTSWPTPQSNRSSFTSRASPCSPSPLRHATTFASQAPEAEHCTLMTIDSQFPGDEPMDYTSANSLLQRIKAITRNH